jgi:uncharacterized protein (TIGR03083 family)
VNGDPRIWIATLRRSHDNLARIAGSMTPEQVRGQSYCRDWTSAQVLSHLGSGAEIALMGLPGALGEGPPVSRDDFPAVWDAWNAKSPDDQAADALTSDERHVQRLEQLTDEELAAARMDFLGMQLDATGIIRLRLGEHVLHTWDLAVMQDPAATVQADAVELLIDNVPQFLAPRLGKPLAEPFRVRITTTDPGRDYLLTSAESVTVVNWPGEAPASGDGDGDVPHVQMPAEALLRLSYGRLDPAHTPEAVSGDPEVLDKLRAIFPGF